jgi:hypothetical protein
MADFAHGGPIPATEGIVGLPGELDVHPERRPLVDYRPDLSVFDTPGALEAIKRLRGELPRHIFGVRP